MMEKKLQLAGDGQERLGRMALGRGTVLALWGLRLYVMAMLAIIGAKFVTALVS